MARIILKDPNSPSVKKTIKPPSVKYKRFFKISFFINLKLITTIVYLLNRSKGDQLIKEVIQFVKLYIL